MTIKKGFQFHNRGPKSAEVMIYDDIGEGWFGGISSKQFAEEIKKLGNVTDINVRINSQGGSVFDGVAIYNTLLNHPAKITVDIDSAALSIASVIAMAGDQINMASNALFMIHEPHGVFSGSSGDLRKNADLLDMVGDQIIETYNKNRGIEVETLRNWLEAETWFTASEALAAGFVDKITGEMSIAAHVDKTRFKNAPADLQNDRKVIKIPDNAKRERARAALTRMKSALIARD